MSLSDPKEEAPGPEENVPDQARLLALAADVGRTLVTRDSLTDMLRGCAEAVVAHLDAAFARVWTLNEAGDTLELQASAGQYTHLDGPHGRVPVGKYKIGLIAQERRPHLTNAVVGDPRVSDQEWAVREGMVAFAGYPLVVEDRLIGVAALFARHVLTDATLQALGSVADQIAVGIEHKHADAAVLEANRRTAGILESISDAFFALDTGWRFTYLNDRAEELLQRPRAELLGRSVWEEFPNAVGTRFEGEYRRAASEQKAVTFEEYYPPPLDTWFEVRAYPSPDGLSVYFHNINERRALERERERLLAETERLLAEAQWRAEREALLNGIGRAIRGTEEPDEIQAAAVDALGGALGADRCYFLRFDQARDYMEVGRDFHRADLPSLAGGYPMSSFGVDAEEQFRGGRTLAVADTQAEVSGVAWSPRMAEAFARMGVRALVNVPLHSGGRLVGALGLAMTDTPRAWTASEVFLAEEVAAMTRSAAETARVARREHRIAEQLQSALQPDLPRSVTGLGLAKHYEAALEEAGVGGDFYDVFALEKGCTVLAVGDLSGKGLPAAAQVATVRNMLRAFLYSKPTLAEAVTDLNRVLALNDLLTGFATLWVGCYDSSTRGLAYVNCGQEPALLWRAATGEAEQLLPTGPVLGANANARYEERAVTLSPGDAVTVFTDGVTECGPSRQEMLGVEGVAALLAPPFAPEETESASRMADAVVRRIVAGVDAASRGGVAKDDVCILATVAGGGSSVQPFASHFVDV